MNKVEKSNRGVTQATKSIQQTQSMWRKNDKIKDVSIVGNDKTVSDEVLIEIVHAFKDIIIEFIQRKYQASPK